MANSEAAGNPFAISKIDKRMNSLLRVLMIAVACEPVRCNAVDCEPSTEKTWDFEKFEAGRKPDGFYFDETGRAPHGKWRVIQDEGNKALAQIDSSRDNDRYALAVVEDLEFEDVEVSVRIKALAGDSDQAGGVIWRYRNSENYLVARIDISERNVRLYRFVRGNRTQFGVKDGVNIQLGEWYTLRVVHKDDEIQVYLDGDVLFIERDRHFRDAGKIGLWTKADSVVYFDDLKAHKLDGR